MEKLYTVAKTRLGADCGLDHELLIEKFRARHPGMQSQVGLRKHLYEQS